MCSVIGLGFVGSALLESFQIKSIQPLVGYDKFKRGGINCLEDCLATDVVFICLPTPFDEVELRYDQSAIEETLQRLYEARYEGTVVLKSTVEPGTTKKFEELFPTLHIIHNPEFLSAATAFTDFHNQKHVVLGRGSRCGDKQFENVRQLYEKNYPQAELSLCRSTESESMKSFVNTFYAVKIQFFNELYVLCQKNGTDYNTVKDMMLKNGWINPMHTSVPGRDGRLSYGGGCFPKDTNALLEHMKKQGTPHAVLEGCIKERNLMREEGYDPLKRGNAPTVNGYSNGHSHMNGHTDGSSLNGHSMTNGHSDNLTNDTLKNGHETNGSTLHVKNGHLVKNSHSNGDISNGYLSENEYQNLENGLLISGREAFFHLSTDANEF